MFRILSQCIDKKQVDARQVTQETMQLIYHDLSTFSKVGPKIFPGQKSEM